MYLYKIVNNISGSIYIGITRVSLKQRFYSHKSCAKRGVKSKLYDAMRKYGVDNFSIHLLIEHDNEKELLESEVKTIETLKDCGYNLYNILKGGVSYFPIKDKEEWKRKLRKSRKGRKPALGMKHTEENKKLFSKLSREYWDSQTTYDKKEILKYSFKEAKDKFGISKTHYYRIRKLGQELTTPV